MLTPTFASARRPLLSAFTFIALAVVATSCRDTVTGPHAMAATSIVTPRPAIAPIPEPAPPAAVDSLHAMVPEVIGLTSDVRGDALVLRGQLRSRSKAYTPFYDPSKAGGWALQVFVNSDPTRADYWLGFDYVVRGVEYSRAAGTFVTRRITLDESTPGGWGPQSGTATFTQRGRNFEITIPLESIGGIPGDTPFCLETYATRACAACDGGVTEEFADDYFATVHDVRSHIAGNGVLSRPGLGAHVLPASGHTADADRRLVETFAQR